MKHSRKLIISLLSLLIVSTVIYSIVFPHILRGMMVRQSDFVEIADHVFVSPQTSEGQRDSLLTYLDTAHSRNEKFWDQRIAFPDVVFCHDIETAKEYGYGGSPASFFMTPFYSFVMIAPTGLHPDIISHEMCHPELFQRAGWLKHTLVFPVWFFEGIAMQVDHRAFYSDSAWQVITNQGETAPPLESMDDLAGFFDGNFQLNYSTSKHEVNRWLNIVGNEGIKSLIEESGLTTDFYELYRKTEGDFAGR